MGILKVGEAKALAILENQGENITIDELVNKVILTKFSDYYYFEKSLSELSKKFQQWKELESRLVSLDIFTKNGEIKSNFKLSYNKTKFIRQTLRKSHKSPKVVSIVISE